MEEYHLEDTIGFGSFSVVKKARHLKAGQYVAIKIVSPEDPKEDQEDGDRLLVYDRRRIAREIGHWRTLRHDNLCKLLRIIEFEGKVAFVMEFAEGGDLLKYLLDNKPLEPKQIRSYFYQLCQAVQYLHSVGLVHGDIKLENILLSEPEEGEHDPAAVAYRKALLSDFGLTRRPSDEALVNCGTIEYAAPELISSELSSDDLDPFKSDIWSLGIVLYALHYRKFPFDAPSAKVMKGRILHHEPEYGGGSEAASAAIELIQHLLKKHPSERPSFEHIFSSPFFQF